MPIIGFGTWMIEDLKLAAESVRLALEIGYRHIDTARIYNNEQGVGEGIRQSGLKREEVFLTTKLWNTDQGYDTTLKAFDGSLKQLQTDYVDLYLIHWPKPASKDSWKAMEKIYKEGRAKAIGVSNFHIHHLEDLFPHCEVFPMVNQIEFHPYLTQPTLVDFCRRHTIQFEAWSPLMRGGVKDIPLIQELAKKYERSIAQIVLRWITQLGIATIPKSTTPARIRENFEIFDFSLSDEDIKAIDTLNKGKRVGPDPDNFDF